MRVALIVAVVAALAVAASAFSCPSCDAAQCQAAVCGSAAPFYCAAGPSKGGCAANANAFNNTKECTACCDTSACSAQFSCNATCSQAVCQSKNRCSVATPYECTAGTAAGGCSANATFWGTQHTCSSCCDVTGCEKACTACTAAQCATASSYCTTSDPYVCLTGPLAGGCSSSAKYFPDSSTCYSCCDMSSC